MTDSLSDPEAPRVYYDLSEWDFDQQAELASSLAEVEIPHGWDGTELFVPDEFEAATDAVFAEVEARLNIIGKGLPEDLAAFDDLDETYEGDDDETREHELRLIYADTPLTEYDLAEWGELERSLVVDSLFQANIPARWEGEVLLVPTADEEQVDALLDEIESGNVIPVMGDGEDDELPFETLNNFFLAGERLRKHPLDADGLDRLVEALKAADPDRPPRGVELRVWRRACELAQELSDAITSNNEDEEEKAAELASALHDHLRPLI